MNRKLIYNENESESDEYIINYKLLKDFLTPILKEENKRQLLVCYKKKSLKIENFSKSIKKNEKEKGILEYSFVTDRAPKNRKKNKNNKRSSFSTDRQSSKKKNKKKKLKFNIPNKNRSDININKKTDNIKLIKPKKINKNILNSYNLNSERNKPYQKIEKINKFNKDDIKEDKKRNKNYSMKKNNKDGNNKYIQESNRLSSEDISSIKNLESELTSRNRIGFNKWYNYGKDWEEIKMMKYCKIKNELEEKKNAILLEEKKEATFRPKLNKKSIQIVNKNYPNNFFERLVKFEQKKKLNKRKINEKCTPRFRPNLYKSNSCILSKRNYKVLKS